MSAEDRSTSRGSVVAGALVRPEPAGRWKASCGPRRLVVEDGCGQLCGSFWCVTDVVTLADASGSDVVRVLTDAFVDDPGWRDVGPERRCHRRLVMRSYHRALRCKALRWGRPGYAAFRSGQLVGVAVTFDSEAWPPPEPISTLLDVPAFAVAGPPAAVRGWQAGTTIKRAHFSDPHMFLWQLAVDPPVQRSGVGRALMARVLADADDAALPVYLETARPENVPYYRSFGFVETGCESLPRGAPLWLMLRRAANLNRY
jgi:GNAT superfamily N-acetyltransferase